MTAEKRPRDTRYVFRWHVVTYQMKNSLYSLSAFCAQSAVYILYLVCILYPVCGLAVCILHWPIGKACDNTDSIFCPVAILCTYWTLGHSRVETYVYNRNTSSYFCSVSFSFVRHVEFFGGLPLYTRSQTPVHGSRYPVTSFSNILFRTAIYVRRAGFHCFPFERQIDMTASISQFLIATQYT